MSFTDTVRDHARGEWRDILPAIGIPAEALTNSHKPCPACGGRDRFRFDDVNGTGSFICSHYGNGGGDGFHLVQHYLDCDFRRAVNAVGRRFRLAGRGEHPQTPKSAQNRFCAV